MFKVPENKSIQEMEAETLKFWKDNKIFEKSVSQKDENNPYVFYDGPPFISGLPHYGHLLGSIAKDIIPRYWAMKGKRVERVWGWDAHGLTVENKVQKRLGIKNRKDIENYGLEEFTKECYNYTSEVSAEWAWYIDRIGRWVDMENAYKTIDRDYMESVLWVFKSLYDKGLIYEGVRTSLFCTTCGTPVSNFEVAMDNTYKEVEDPSVFVKFPIISEGEYKDINILAWTTTPWTVPSNRGLVLDEFEDYVVAQIDAEKYIVSEKRAQDVFSGKEYKVLKNFKGSELVGLSYAPPYDFFAPGENDFKVYSYSEMVSTEEGTGIVHSAPGFGEVDTKMGMEFGLTVMLVINDEGSFLPGDAGENPFEGMFYKKANKFISKDLHARNLMFKEATLVHRFPYHDRCDTLLIQKAQNSWFIKVSDLKQDLVENNEKINWVPNHLKHGRFRQGIEQAPDWCISRARFWATPMPVWRAEDGDTIVIGSIQELEDLSGQPIKDLHRPYIDEVVINKNGKEYKRIPEVLDSWFEAGSMPYGQVHYPFENEETFSNSFPGDFIIEYIAQVRAWFYVMHVLSTALFERNSFKNVISTGVMAGNDGRKMSKTYGNYADPKEILETVGGDALRLYLMGSPLMVGENANFDDVELRTKVRNVLNPLWNSLKFFLIYAELHEFKPESDLNYKNLEVLDKWILTRLNETIRDFTQNIEEYTVPGAIEPLEKFVDDLSRWYVRRSRDRISDGDKNALITFYTVLMSFAKVAAPAIPFIAESMYQALNTGKAESVHLEEYPEWSNEIIVDGSDVVTHMEVVRDVVSKALSIRVEKKIPVRMPLGALYVKHSKLDEAYLDLIKDELNIKEVLFVEPSTDSQVVWDTDQKIGLDINITEELKIEGSARDMVRTFQSLRKKMNLNVEDKIVAYYEQDELSNQVVKVHKDMIMEKIGAQELVPSNEYKVVQK